MVRVQLKLHMISTFEPETEVNDRRASRGTPTMAAHLLELLDGMGHVQHEPGIVPGF